MSYCVNCGVKVDNSEPKCPLCGTLILNPNLNYNTLNRPYPGTIEDPIKRIDWRYVLKLISLVLLLLSLITLLSDFLTTGSITWSIYVIASSTYLVLFLSFLYFKGYKLPMLISFVGLEFFILLIAQLNNGMKWYSYFALPFIFIIFLFVFLMITLLKRKNKSVLRIIAFSMLYISLSLIVIEILTDLYISNSIELIWSLYAVLPLGILGVVFFLLSFNKKVIEELRQRMFI